MSASPPLQADETEEQPAETKNGGKRWLVLILIAAPAVLLLAIAGLWFTGILPHMLEMETKGEETEQAARSVPPTYIDLPAMTANLNVRDSRPLYMKLQAKVEVRKPEDVERVWAALPHVQDLVQTYLRDMRPEDVRGAAGTYRLREEFLARANAAVAPAKISDVLFIRMVIQ